MGRKQEIKEIWTVFNHLQDELSDIRALLASSELKEKDQI